MRLRFIPTRVGKAAPEAADVRAAAVHPHAGGESYIANSDPPSRAGSSPRGWGKQPGQIRRLVEERFIPTRVGKAARSIFSQSGSTVHPHAGGESAMIADGCRDISGSSPRGWGKLDDRVIQTVGQRFIPTRVGKARGYRFLSVPGSVHPHAGGESTHTIMYVKSQDGSSPRGWGKLAAETHEQFIGRFIPTRVGKATQPRL